MLLWIIAKLLIHFLFAIIWEMKNMLFYMLLFHIFKQWGYFKLEDNQKDVENIISLPLTVKNNYLTWVNKHGTLIYTNMFYTVAPDKTNFRFYTNTVGGYMWGSIGFI